METINELIAAYPRELTTAILVAVTLWAGKRALAALRNWRTTLKELAESKKTKAHARLTTILIQSVSGAPIIISYAIPLFASAFAVILFTAFISGVTLDAYSSAVKFSHNKALGEAAAELLENSKSGDTTLSENAKLAMAQTNKTKEEELHEGLAKLRFWLPVSQVFFVFCLVVTASVFYGAYLMIYRAVPNMLTALPMSFWLQSYVMRLLAIATKDESRQLVALEQNVDDELTLLKYLTYLRQLAVKYDFQLVKSISQWIDTSTDRMI